MKNTRGQEAYTILGLPMLAATLFAAILMVTGCSNGTTGSIGTTEREGIDMVTTPPKYREMKNIAGQTVPGSTDPAVDGTSMEDGVFINGRDVPLGAYKIAVYETTYQLWKEVYDWAITRNYVFSSPGVEGHGSDGTGKAGTAEERMTRPVTGINWRDAVVWCNAYSEMSGKSPVYYTDAQFTVILKTSTKDSGTDTAADKVVVKTGATGYRLPTEAEWECAARGGDPSGQAWNNKYAGINNTKELRNYAWYVDTSYTTKSGDLSYGIHPVGTKAANAAGLYDMNGNVREWCWDWASPVTAATPVAGSASGVGRIVRSGGWYDQANNCTVAARHYFSPYIRDTALGFRVASR